MNTHRLRVAATLAGIAAVTMAIYQVTTPGSPGATFGSLSDWFRDLTFLTYLCAVIVACSLGRRPGADGDLPLITPWPAGLIRGGYALIAVGTTYGLVVQDDPDWFFVLAGPSLVASTIGYVWFAVSGLRRGVLPLWSALLAGVGGPVAIILAELGTSVLIGAFWLWVGLGPVLTQPHREATPTAQSRRDGRRVGRA